MRRNLLKTAVMVLALVLALSAMVSCDALANLFGGDEGGTNTPAQHTVTFDLGGGTAGEGFEETAKVINGNTVTLPEVTREGHTFLGWFVGETEFSAETPITSDKIITAKWEIQKFTVTFLNHLNQLLKEEIVEWGTAATPPDNVLADLSGMPFKEWSADITSVKSDLTVKPIYARKTYTVTFSVGDAKPVESQTVYFGEKPVRPDDPDLMGYSLVDWYLDEACTLVCDFNTAFDANTTLYAKFIADYIPISTADELNNIRNDTTKKYVLLNDINLGGNPWTPIENFSGAIDGNGYKIYDFSMTTTEHYLGFINQNSGLIKNLKFDDFRISFDHSAHHASYSGIIAAVNSGTIRNCEILNNDVSITMNVSLSSGGTHSSHLGVLVGYNTGTVKNCTNNADITINTYTHSGYNTGTTRLNIYAASAVGLNTSNGLVDKVEAYGKITLASTSGGVSDRSSNQNYFFIGGIVGMNNTGSTVSESAANVQISCELTGSLSAKNIDLGLIAGKNVNTITNCYANGSLTVSSTSTTLSGTIGGAVGVNETMCKIENIYADVDITVGNGINAYVGGLLGQNKDGAKVNKTVYTGNITVGANVGAYGFMFAVRTGEIAHCYYDSISALKVAEETKTEGTCTDGAKTAVETLFTENFLYTTLQWDKDIWSITEGSAPTLNALN